MAKRTIIMLVASVPVFGGLSGFVLYRKHPVQQFLAIRQAPPVAVAGMTAPHRNWVSRIPSVGILDTAEEVDITTSVTGVVVALDMDSGQRVHRGDVLVRIESAVEQVQLDQAVARLPAVQSTPRRVRALAAQGNASQAPLDEAELQI